MSRVLQKSQKSHNSHKSAILRLDHLVLYSGDVGMALDFYGQLPGCATSLEKGRGVARIGKQKINIHPFPPVLRPVAKHAAIGRQRFCLGFGGNREALIYGLVKRGMETRQDHERLYLLDPDKNYVDLSYNILGKDKIFNCIESLSLRAGNMGSMAAFYGRLPGKWERFFDPCIIYNFKEGFMRLYPAHQLCGTCGASDFCLLTELPVEKIYENYKRLDLAGLLKEPGICERNGALGPLRSIYFHDPEGNLLELANYTD